MSDEGKVARPGEHDEPQDEVGVADLNGADGGHHCELVGGVGRDTGATTGCSKWWSPTCSAEPAAAAWSSGAWSWPPGPPTSRGDGSSCFMSLIVSPGTSRSCAGVAADVQIAYRSPPPTRAPVQPSRTSASSGSWACAHSRVNVSPRKNAGARRFHITMRMIPITSVATPMTNTPPTPNSVVNP